MDHGTRYLSDHFTGQIRFRGIHPSYSLVGEPQGNGVVERFNRTLKEQVVHGRVYRNINELRGAVRKFVKLYNDQWLVEKNGFLSLGQAREEVVCCIDSQRRSMTKLCLRNWVRYRNILKLIEQVVVEARIVKMGVANGA